MMQAVCRVLSAPPGPPRLTELKTSYGRVTPRPPTRSKASPCLRQRWCEQSPLPVLTAVAAAFPRADVSRCVTTACRVGAERAAGCSLGAVHPPQAWGAGRPAPASVSAS